MVYSSEKAMSIRCFLVIELHFEMNKDIPIENNRNHSKLRDNDENIQNKRYFRIESAYLRKRNTINMITITASLMAILSYLNNTVYPREYDHEH